MTTTCELLDAIKSRHHLPSDYALAAKLGTTRSCISNYRCRRSHLDDMTAIRVAELLEVEAGYVMACAHSERAKSDAERTAWQSIMQKLGGAAALALIGLGGLSAPSPANAATPSPEFANRYYVKSRRNRKNSAFAAIFTTLLPSAPFKQVS